MLTANGGKMLCYDMLFLNRSQNFSGKHHTNQSFVLELEFRKKLELQYKVVYNTDTVQTLLYSSVSYPQE